MGRLTRQEAPLIRVGIVGYGNIGRGVIKAIGLSQDMELAGIFTRRPEAVQKQAGGVPVFSNADAFRPDIQKSVDVMVLCGGSKEDIPDQGPQFAEHFNTVDSFDTHANIPAYFAKMNSIAKANRHVCIVSAGWDPGIFSLERMLGDAFLPGSKQYTFWGRGVSQGHSDAVRQIAGVLDARQYTIPVEDAIARVRRGERPDFTPRDMHERLVYVVAEEGADRECIRRDIESMPNYFAPYNTKVVFITQDEMRRDHSAYPHGGFVLTSGSTGANKHVLEYRCQLDSNPEFTGSVLVACARAAWRLKRQRKAGAFTLMDFPPALLSPRSSLELLSKMT